MAWSRGNVQLPTQASRDGQLVAGMPGVLPVQESLSFAPGARHNRYVATDQGWYVNQEACKIVRLRGRPRATIQKGCAGAECKVPPRAKRLRLHQIIAQPAYISAPLKGVITPDLGPVVDHIDVGLTPVPWLRSEEHTSELQSRENLVC